MVIIYLIFPLQQMTISIRLGTIVSSTLLSDKLSKRGRQNQTFEHS